MAEYRLPFSGDKEKLKVFQRNWISDRKEKYISDLGPCIFCGTLKNIEIHHIDPTQKESHRIWSWREDRLKAELKQCIPMCHDCHKKFHDLMKRKPLVHGTVNGFWMGCRCKECTEARAVYRTEHEYKQVSKA